MTSKANVKFLKDALNQLEFALSDLEDFVYYTEDGTCSNIASNVNEQIVLLKNLISDLEDY